MNAALLILVGVHVAVSLWVFARRTGRHASPALRRFSILLQFAIFLSGCLLAYRTGAFSRALLSPPYIALGILAGHLIFGLSLLMTDRKPANAAGHFVDLPSLWAFGVEHPYVLSRFAVVAVTEEIIWRAAAQPAAQAFIAMGARIPAESPAAAAAAVALVAIAFSIVHDHFFRNETHVSIEFLGFALLLGALYAWTSSLILVIVIHAVRDIEIAYLEYLVKVNELGDEAAAAKEIERIYSRADRIPL